MSFSVDKTLLPKYMHMSINFREPPFRVEMSPFFIKSHVLYFVCIRRDQCHLLPAPDSEAEVKLR